MNIVFHVHPQFVQMQIIEDNVLLFESVDLLQSNCNDTLNYTITQNCFYQAEVLLTHYQLALSSPVCQIHGTNHAHIGKLIYHPSLSSPASIIRQNNNKVLNF